MKIQILITTYNRPQLLLNLLKDIKSESKDLDVSLLILNDGSDKDYLAVTNYLCEYFAFKFRYYKTDTNFGKPKYWSLIDNAFNRLKDYEFDYLIQIPDDILLVKDFFKNAIESFEALPDDERSCLNILNDYSRNGKTFWTNQNLHEVTYSGYDFLNTGWVDMCYITKRNFLEALEYKINPVDHDWSTNKELSSGVGMQLSKRLIKKGFTLYHVLKSLVIHDDHVSVMHPNHRKNVPLISNHHSDKITATCATMPGREVSLQQSVLSLLHQVDEIHIYFNNIKDCPIFINNPKIKCFFSEDYSGDLGDAGKFYTADEIKGYHFTFDDDIIYPSDYVSTLINKIEEHNRKCIVSCHGRLFENLPVQSFYKGHSQAFHCMGAVANDVFAHVIGTGVLAYHTDTIDLDLSVFKFSNMADIWFSKFCNENNVPRIIMGHRKGWLKLSEHFDEESSIFKHQSINDTFQTEVVNSVVWDSVL